MPAKTRQPAASTIRVRQTRARKKIARLRLGRKWDLLLWALQSYYRDRELPLTTWIFATDLHNAAVTTKDIYIKVFLPGETEFLNALQDPAIEIATVRRENQDVTICRPKFLGNEVNS